MKRLSSYLNCDSGTVAIEGVFALPLLILIGFGAVDGSLLMMQNHKVENGLVSAGNYLARTPAPAAFEGQAKRLATTGQLNIGGERKVKNWAEGDVAIAYQVTDNTDTGSGRDYRGGDSIRVVQLSTTVSFEGIGFIKSISGGAVKIEANYEERLVADLS